MDAKFWEELRHNFMHIQLNKKKAYHSGDKIEGKVTISREQALENDELILDTLGESAFEFKDPSNSERTLLSGHINYNIDEHRVILDCKDTQEIESYFGSDGKGASIPFEFQLPMDLPGSSFKDEVGFIQYAVRARWLLKGDTVTETNMLYPVERPLDLNKYPKDLRLGQGTCKTIPTKWGFFKGSLSCVLRINRGGYVPGECIEVNCEVNNKSRHKLTDTSVSLCQKIRYLGQDQKSVDHVKMLVDLPHFSQIKPGQDAGWFDRIDVQDWTPTQCDDGNIIHIEYFVMVRFFPPCHKRKI